MHADELAPALLGKILCRKKGGTIKRVRITETECYKGETDTACHAAKGKTKRTQVLYEEGGTIYVYLCYGIHEMFNIVAGVAGYPEAVLIRGVDTILGPGRVTKFLDITRELNGKDLCNGEELWIEDDGFSLPYQTAPRVGIGYAAKEDQARPWRFIADS
ncbi:MAG: DNA-3-methyladenine glycosylase [Clostridiales bacterium]|nr:DNA-3-methyladenine glycosylase [Clostridiales bacterium]